MFSSHIDMIYKNSALQDIFVKLLFIIDAGQSVLIALFILFSSSYDRFVNRPLSGIINLLILWLFLRNIENHKWTF